MTGRLTLLFALLVPALTSCVQEKPPPDAAQAQPDSSGPPADAMVCESAPKNYLETCQTDDDCKTCDCHTFGHSMVCTRACTKPEDCEAPSSGCVNGKCGP